MLELVLDNFIDVGQRHLAGCIQRNGCYGSVIGPFIQYLLCSSASILDIFSGFVRFWSCIASLLGAFIAFLSAEAEDKESRRASFYRRRGRRNALDRSYFIYLMGAVQQQSSRIDPFLWAYDRRSILWWPSTMTCQPWLLRTLRNVPKEYYISCQLQLLLC